MSRQRMARFECGHPGCREVAHFNVYGREDERRLYRDNGNGKYRCIRHTRMDEVLTNERRKIIREMASEAKVEGSPKLYWGNFGMAHGPGFKAFADDFPAGTVIRVTAEIILPEAKGDAAEDALMSTERHEVTSSHPRPSMTDDIKSAVEAAKRIIDTYGRFLAFETAADVKVARALLSRASRVEKIEAETKQALQFYGSEWEDARTTDAKELAPTAELRFDQGRRARAVLSAIRALSQPKE